MNNSIKDIFNKHFNYLPDKSYFSPGRVNIIGGHTDYNGGAVLPFCINLGIYGAITFRNDSMINVYSHNFSRLGGISFDLEKMDQAKDLGFVDYVVGTILIYKENGYLINKGFDLAIHGNLPKGGGLSSSAAFLVLIGNMFNDYFKFNLSGAEIAKLARSVENDYIGVKCGIMDQFIIANGLKDHALYLETDSLNYEHVPLILDDYKFILVNSRTTRKLVESNYNTRQKESLDVLNTLKKHVDINHICELKPNDYYKYEKYISEIELKNRFKHLVDEHHRVVLSKAALINKDYITLGKLLTEAHYSAKDLYKVSSDTLDNLVEMGLSSGSIGSKMIGGGFGGSTLNLVKASHLDSFLNVFTENYKKAYHQEPIINIVFPMDKAGELND